MDGILFRRALPGLATALAFILATAPARAQGQYKLGPGDKVRVTVFGEEELSGEFEVDGAGSLSLKAIGRMQVGGLSLPEVEQMIAAKYKSSGYLRNPRVSAEVVNRRPFFILGEVEKRGSYPYVNGMTVAQAVAIAGGYTYRASKSRITVQRFGRSTQERVTEDEPIFPGDTIRVPERFF